MSVSSRLRAVALVLLLAAGALAGTSRAEAISSASSARLDRVYAAATGIRIPYSESRRWSARIDAGMSVERVAKALTATDAFRARFDGTDDRTFVDRAYQLVLGRPAEPAALHEWTHHLGNGSHRGELIHRLAASPEYEQRYRQLFGTTRTVSYGPNRKQVVDVYEPASTRRTRTVVLLHGGCWSSGDQTRWNDVAGELARRGVVVYNARYRTGAGAKAITADVRKVVALAAANPRTDPGRLILVGDSAGGHLALLEGLKAGSPAVRAIAALSPVTNPRGALTTDPEVSACFAQYAGADFDDQDPMRFLGPKAPRIRLFASEADPVTDPSSQIHPFVSKALRAGVRPSVTVYDLCGSPRNDHGVLLLPCAQDALLRYVTSV